MNHSDNSRSYCLYSLLFLVGVASLAVAGSLSFELWVGTSVLFAVNINALFLMGLDKSLAGSASLRVPEVLLFVIALLGGGPGIVLGSHVFRHKIRKAGFQFVLLLIGLAQITIVSFLGIEFR